MRETMKLAVRLMVFALVAGLALAAMNAVTEEPIRRNQNRQMNTALVSVLGEYQFEPLSADLVGYDDIQAVYAAKDAAGAVVGYAYELAATGFGGAVRLSVGIRDGAVSAVSISSHTETRGLGTTDEAPFLARFAGIAASPDAAGAVDGMSGATVSSTAVRGAVSQALKHATEVLGAGGAYDGPIAEPQVDAVTEATGEAGAAATEAPQADAVTEATGEADAAATEAPQVDAVTEATGA